MQSTLQVLSFDQFSSRRFWICRSVTSAFPPNIFKNPSLDLYCKEWFSKMLNPNSMLIGETDRLSTSSDTAVSL